MQIHRRFLLTGVAAVAATALTPSNAYACSCVDGAWEELITQSDVIFRGRPISTQILSDNAPAAPTRIQRVPPPELMEDVWREEFMVHTIETLDVLKGDLGILAQIYERDCCTTCNLGIRPGQVLLVFAWRGEGGRLVSIPCAGIHEDASGATTRWVAERMRAARLP